MKYPTKNSSGTPLQFGGKAGRLAHAAPPEAGVSERFATTQSTAAEVEVAAANPAQFQDSNAEEIKAVAMMAESALAFSSQLGRFQRSANLAIVCTCLPILGVYAFVGFANI